MGVTSLLFLSPPPPPPGGNSVLWESVSPLSPFLTLYLGNDSLISLGPISSLPFLIQPPGRWSPPIWLCFLKFRVQLLTNFRLRDLTHPSHPPSFHRFSEPPHPPCNRLSYLLAFFFSSARIAGIVYFFFLLCLATAPTEDT